MKKFVAVLGVIFGFYSIGTSQTLWAWGENSNGQLGLGNDNNYDTAQKVGTQVNWKYVQAGQHHTAGILKDGSLWTWGKNDSGELGIGNKTTIDIPVRVGSLNDWTSVQLGSEYSIALRKNGTLWAWGSNKYGQLGLGNTISYNKPQQVGSDTNWVLIHSGQFHSLAIKKDGSLWAWGRNKKGQLGLGDTINYNTPQQVGSETNWSIVQAGKYFSVAKKKNGTLWVWGRNNFGQLGLGNSTSFNAPQKVGSDSNWAIIATGSNHTAAIKKDGSLYTWGRNSDGELGLGDTTNYNSPQKLGSSTKWIGIDLGDDHTLGLKSDSTIWAWGGNNSGQLGLGNANSYNYPVQIGSKNNWKAVSAGFNYSLLLFNDCSYFKPEKLSTTDTLTSCSTQSISSKIYALNKTNTIYGWSNGAKTQKITVNNSGWVKLTERDTLVGCTNRDSVYVRIIKDEIFTAVDTNICNVQKNTILHIDLNKWFRDTNFYFYSNDNYNSSVKFKQITTAKISVTKSAIYQWKGFVSPKSNPSLMCFISGKVKPAIVYPRLVTKNTDTILSTKSMVKPIISDKRYTSYLWSNNSKTRTTNLYQSGQHWFKQSDNFGCSQTDSFHFSILNLKLPAQINAKLGSKIIVRVSDSLNSSSQVVWSTGDTGWHTTYHVTKNTDALFATQSDAYGSITKSVVINGKAEPVKLSQEENNHHSSNQSTSANENLTDTILNFISLYPNPTRLKLFIQFDHNFKLDHVFEIYDVTGKSILIQKIKSKTETVDVSNLNNGIYFAVIKDKNNREIEKRKIVIE